VATALSEGESRRKHVVMIEIMGQQVGWLNHLALLGIASCTVCLFLRLGMTEIMGQQVGGSSVAWSYVPAGAHG